MKKITLPNSVKKILTSKISLYIAVFLSLTNLLGYISINDTTSIMVFLLSGLATSYYTGNMVLILVIPMIITNALYAIDSGFCIRETMVEGRTTKKKTDKKVAKKAKKGGDLDINETETYEEFFKDIGKTMKGDSLEKMTNQTQQLIESQVNLKKAMGQLTPMVDNAKKMMKNLGDMGNLAGFEGFDPKNMNASVKNIMNQFMNSNVSDDDAKGDVKAANSRKQ